QRERLQVRVRLQQLLLPDLELGQARALAYEIDAQVILPLVHAARHHVLDRGDQVAGAQVATAEAEAAGVEVRHLVGRDGGQSRERLRAVPGPRVLRRLRHG